MKALALATVFCSLPAFAAESGGQAEIALQGYSLGGNEQPPERIAGLAVSFHDFLPRVGVLSGNFEGYATGQFRTGENFLELQGLPWLGRHWTLRAGDFQTSAALVDFPFYNVFVPEIKARGLRVAARRDSVEYEFFCGRESIEEGPRVPFRVNGPQLLTGAAVRYKRGRLQTGVRYVRFSDDPTGVAGDSSLFPSGRAFDRVDSFTAQALYRIVRTLRLYGEASQATATGAPGGNASSPFSTLAGLVWETTKLTARANYARQSATYFPLAGYFAGDREGPFAEVRYRPWAGVEVLGSAGWSRNNVQRNPNASTFQSTSLSAGATAKLPWTSTGTVQLSTIRLSVREPGAGFYSDSDNRHLSAGLAHPFRHHTIRVAAHDLKFTAGGVPERQHWAEAEDTFRLKRFVLGADVRMQQSVDSQRRNTVFLRGMLQFNTRSLTVFGNMETGNDLINRTVFATNTYRTAVAGITGHLDRNWDVQVEAFRNSLNMALNPESIFILESGGIGLANAMSSLDQWSVFLRLARHLQWGHPPPAADLDAYANSQAPLKGTVEGFVREKRVAGEFPAAGIPVSLDGNRTVTSDGEGRFRFSEVAEGVHRVLLSTTDLPAEYDPDAAGGVTVAVRPRHTARADFAVLRLTALAGKVTGPDNVSLENIVVRLLPARRYTTTREDGRFVFYNMREGDYEVRIEADGLPDGAVVSGPDRIPVAVRLDTAMSEIHFEVRTVQKLKAVRRVDLN